MSSATNPEQQACYLFMIFVLEKNCARPKHDDLNTFPENSYVVSSMACRIANLLSNHAPAIPRPTNGMLVVRLAGSAHISDSRNRLVNSYLIDSLTDFFEQVMKHSKSISMGRYVAADPIPEISFVELEYFPDDLAQIKRFVNQALPVDYDRFKQVNSPN